MTQIAPTFGLQENVFRVDVRADDIDVAFPDAASSVATNVVVSPAVMLLGTFGALSDEDGDLIVEDSKLNSTFASGLPLPAAARV
ncbi:hypothetical protein [Pandoraea cepalis]|uniref:hypothetical protein n=1 Tax=Pandoraea cepalis TaxID=2508294 RepID=UPI001241BAE0|nr:hypothetical protein [Pandoraea cepalis]